MYTVTYLLPKCASDVSLISVTSRMAGNHGACLSLTSAQSFMDAAHTAVKHSDGHHCMSVMLT